MYDNVRKSARYVKLSYQPSHQFIRKKNNHIILILVHFNDEVSLIF
jgi:hypothetical protein